MLHGWSMYNPEAIWMLLTLIVSVAIVTAVILLLVETLPGHQTHSPRSPLEIVAYRYARGEIDDVEYRRLRNALPH